MVLPAAAATTRAPPRNRPSRRAGRGEHAGAGPPFRRPHWPYASDPQAQAPPAASTATECSTPAATETANVLVIDSSVVARPVAAPKPATRRGVEDGGSNLLTANEPSDGGSFSSSPRATPSLPWDASPHAHTAPALSHASACAFPTETAVTFVFGANPRVGAGTRVSKTPRWPSTAPGSPQLQSRPVRSSTLNPQPAPMASFASGLCARRKMARHEVAPKGTPRDARVPRLGSPTSRGRCARAHPWDASSARPGRHSASSAAARSRGSSAPRAEATTTASRSASAMVSWGGEDTIACAAECPRVNILDAWHEIRAIADLQVGRL